MHKKFSWRILVGVFVVCSGSDLAFGEDIFHTTRSSDGQPIAESTQGIHYPLIPIEQMIEEIEAKKQALPENAFRLAINPFEILRDSPSLHPFEWSILAPTSYSLASNQTAIRDQLGRGTCWAFASVAAIEAAYRRKHGLTLDLSEQYAFHIGKSGELYPDYVTNAAQHENNSSHWGFQGNSGFLKSLVRAALPEERFAPYLSNDQMEALRRSLPSAGALDWNSNQEQLDALEWSQQHIPLAARHNAKYRVVGTFDLYDDNKNTLIDKLEQTISSGKEVAADFTLKWKYDATKNAYDYDSSADNGGHVMLIIGYDRNQQIFTLKNSWGGSSYLRVTYNFVKNAYLWGTGVTDVDAPNAANQTKAFWLGNWNMDHDGWKGQLVIRRFTDFRNGDPNAATKLGNYYSGNNRYDVNGYFEDNGQRMIFTVADVTQRIRPGEMRGQRHEMHVFSWDPSNAGGKTYWQGIPFGSQISRNAISGQPGRDYNPNKWIGNWAMNHDGWRGTLSITGFRGNQIIASYRGNDGQVRGVWGQYDPAQKHRINMTIGFPGNNQNFEILFHTWENNLFSGVTQWGGRNFGVQGVKQ